MAKKPTKPKREDFKEAAFRVVREATEGKPEKPVDGSATWATPIEEESPPPKIP